MVIWSYGHMVIWSSGHLFIYSNGRYVIWSSGHLVIWSSGFLVIWSSGHLVIWSSGHLVTWSSGHLVIWLCPIFIKTVLFLWNTWIICAHIESCFGDLIEQSGYLVFHKISHITNVSLDHFVIVQMCFKYFSCWNILHLFFSCFLGW